MRILLLLLLAITSMCCSKSRNPRILIKTDMGVVEAELFLDKAPITAANFLRYVDSGKFNNGYTNFYRVVRMDNQPNKQFKIEVVQGGYGNDSIIEKYQFAPIRHETTIQTGVLHKNGVLSMARNDPGTASSEFFICIGDQPELDFEGNRNPDKQGFAAFGKVVKGIEIVKKIQQMKDTLQYLKNPVKIISITRAE